MSQGGHSNARVVIAALAGNGLIAIAKFVAAFFSGSIATLAEAIHSVADTANQALLLIGLRRAEKPATVLHPFGHAVESYFWPFIVSMLIFLLGGLFALVEGVRDLLAILGDHAVESHGSPYASYAVLGVSLVFEGMSFRVALGEFRNLQAGRGVWETLMHAKDPTIPVVLAEDSAAMFGLAIAFFAVLASHLTGWHGFDAIGSALIGILLAAIAFFLAKRTHSLLIGEAITEADRQAVEAAALSVEGVERVTQLLSMHLGPTNVILAMKVGFDDRFGLHEIEEAINDLEDRIRTVLPHMRYIFVEPDSRYTIELDEARPSELPQPRRRKNRSGGQ